MLLEILDKNDKVLSARRLEKGLTLLGKSPGAHVRLGGADVGPLHVAIKNGPKPALLDLGGPVPLKVDGKEVLEYELVSGSVVFQVGAHRLRLGHPRARLPELRKQEWRPLAETRSTCLALRARFYVNGRPHEVINSRSALSIPSELGLAAPARVAWIKGGVGYAKLPAQWLALGGRIQAGRDRILNLNEWAADFKLEPDVIYRVFAGTFVLELLLSSRDGITIGAPAWRPLEPELRKPLAVSAGSAVAIFLLWILIFTRPPEKVEEPYAVYARIQNIPVEKLPEPEQPPAPSDQPQAGGGAGSESQVNTAPTAGQAPAAAPSKLASALTGGLKNLFGSVVAQATKPNTAVIAESGVGVAAAAGAPGPAVGKLSAMGQGTTGVAGAAKLGNLAIAGSGKGFSGGSGVGLGSGAGAGIGNGVGNGIGKGGFRLIEEESIVDGGLDKSVIAAVIQNNLAQIKYCYERQLVAEPDLFGKVVVSWIINASGLVEAGAVKQTTLNSQPVERCMLGKIAAWKFPQPKNGTKVNVVYPFLFKSTN